jgi:Fur family transcriptional regulator, ferric uptake regulator
MLANQLHRNTRQRQVILEELQNLISHPTAAALHEIVRRRLPKISLGTVYRNLELMARLGLIQKLDFCGCEARFDGNVARHDHLRCVRCGRVDDVSAPPLDLFEGAANDWCGYEIIGHRLEFLGICPCCRAGHDNCNQVGSGSHCWDGGLTATPATDVAPAIPLKPR